MQAFHLGTCKEKVNIYLYVLCIINIFTLPLDICFLYVLCIIYLFTLAFRYFFILVDSRKCRGFSNHYAKVITHFFELQTTMNYIFRIQYGYFSYTIWILFVYNMDTFRIHYGYFSYTLWILFV